MFPLNSTELFPVAKASTSQVPVLANVVTAWPLMALVRPLVPSLLSLNQLLGFWLALSGHYTAFLIGAAVVSVRMP